MKLAEHSSEPGSGAGEFPRHVDVLIVGAGISGIGAAYHLQSECPQKTYAILEGRDTLGGTWDLFRYPGIRSDSDMYTLGYGFRPWRNPKAIADGPAILEYLRETAEAYGIDRKIHYRCRVRSASWSSADALWTVAVERVGVDGKAAGTLHVTTSFLYMCAGYFDYDAGYTPEFNGVSRFRGLVVHPQLWSSDIDYAGKRVVIIGSGATAVTLAPTMAETAAHVTLLQRSPTYIVSVPGEDAVANWLRKYLPARLAHALVRTKNVGLGMVFFNLSRRFPTRAKEHFIDLVREALGPSYDVETHFTPRYNPWDQRVCLVPDGDLFEAIRAGKVAMVTDRIDTFTETGLRLCSGAELPADLIITATGLKLRPLGGVELHVDGRRVVVSETVAYKGMMCSGVPNLAFAIGYTNASWTLKCDLTSAFVCRLLNHMDRNGYTGCFPLKPDASVKEEPLIDFSSGYIQRDISTFPRQGSRAPFRLHQNYAWDLLELRHARLEDGVLAFSKRSAEKSGHGRQVLGAPQERARQSD